MSKKRQQLAVPVEISTVEAAAFLHVQVRQVQRLIARGELRARKLAPGGLRSPYLVNQASVVAYYEAHPNTPTKKTRGQSDQTKEGA